jgi:Flp pilus assembly protein TadG
MAIAAAAIVLLLAAVGGGIDMSRAYMAKTNLQSACDSGVLAGRKAMAKSGTYDDAAKAKANKMFNFNVKPKTTNSTNVSFTSQSTATGEVTGTASATMPTTVMKIFKFDGFDLSVTCSAELQMASADIVFVLDTTGSMNCVPADGASCNTGVEHSGSKISALRAAVKEFHKTLAKSVIDKTHTRIRYAFVPYSMTVNVKDLVAPASGTAPMSATYLQSSTNYQTRTALFNTTYYPTDTTTSDGGNWQINGSSLSTGNCEDWVEADSASGGGPPPTTTTTTTYRGSSSRSSYRESTNWGWSGADDTSGTTRSCRRWKTVTTTTYQSTKYYKFTSYRYIQDPVSTSGLATGSVQIVSDIDVDNAYIREADGGPGKYYDMRELAGLTGTSGLTKSNSTWGGCIEERNTVQQLSMDPVPSGAYDLDINSAPSNDATRWKFYWGDMEFDRGSGYQTSRDTTSSIGNESEKCPAPINLFKVADTTDPTTVPSWLDTYVTNLTAAGNTYHDIGMIWGARIGSTRGIFSTNVNEDNDKYPSVSRHIIFMTDGAMQPTTESYSAYGLEKLDHRIAPSGNDDSAMIAYHNNRFIAACKAAEAEGYTVWMVAFGQTITTKMLECTGNYTGVDSDSDRALYASDATALNNAFKYIAGQVADLRINQ